MLQGVCKLISLCEITVQFHMHIQKIMNSNGIFPENYASLDIEHKTFNLTIIGLRQANTSQPSNRPPGKRATDIRAYGFVKLSFNRIG